MRFGSVCSGIEAASVAWAPLGWNAAWFSEIEPFPSAVLAHHYPGVKNLGDMTAIPALLTAGEIEAPDILCGGTPCQAFSVAGLRRSLDDRRGNLALVFCEIANAVDTVRCSRGEQPAVIFWENVPGVLNTKDNAFGCFLAGLAGEDDPLQPPRGKWTNAGAVFGPQRAVAWRVTDAQYFGVAQRRRRVFVVASAREGFDPAAVLFEFDGVRRDSAPSREAGEGTAGGAGAGAEGGRPSGVTIHGTDPTVQKVASYDDLAQCLRARTPGNIDNSSTTVVQQPVITMAHGQGGAEIGFDRCPTLTCNHEAPIAGLPFDTTQVTSPLNYSNPQPGDPCHPLAAGAHVPAVAFHWNAQPDQMRFDEHCSATLTRSQEAAVAYTTKLHNTRSNQAGKVYEEYATSLDRSSPPPALLTTMQVRRLTPVECERLQGFPDGYTAIPWRKKPASECPDGPRYKALGNSWAVPNVRWIGRRIAAEAGKSNAIFA